MALFYREKLIVAIRIRLADILQPDFEACVAGAIRGMDMQFGAVEDGQISFVYKAALPWTEQGTAYADFDALHITLQTLGADTFGDSYLSIGMLTEEVWTKDWEEGEPDED